MIDGPGSAGVDRQAVMARLERLFAEFAGEQALQFEDEWWHWADIAGVHSALSTLLAEQSMGRLGRANDTAAPSPDGAAVAILMRQRPPMVAAELAVLALGRAALVVTPLQPDAQLAAEIGALAPAVLVAHRHDWERDGLLDVVRSSGSLGVSIDDEGNVDVVARSADAPSGPPLDAAVTVLTSGTTGPAKRLPVSWETFVKLGGGPVGRDAVSGQGALILSLPLVTLGGLLSMARLVFGGRPMAMLERFDVHAWAALVKEHRPRIIGAPPPAVKMILDAGISPDHFEGVTAFMTSSAPVAPEVAAAFEARYGIPVLLGYGATEFLGSVTGWTPQLWAEHGSAKLGSVGRPTAGVRLRVVDPDSFDEVDHDQVGVLEVDPPQRAEGLASGWLRTSDRARIDADGFLWILGRTDDVIIRGGFKVDLHTVDEVLLAHPSVAAACTVGLPDARLGMVPGSVVALESTSGIAPSEAELLDWARERLAAYAVPTKVQIVDSIPLTSTFKAHRSAVAQLLAPGSGA